MFNLKMSYVAPIDPSIPKSAVAKQVSTGQMKFKEIEWTEQTLKDFVQISAFASWQFNGKRNATNIVANSANSFILDFDSETPNIEQALEFFESLDINYFLFTTVSHQKEKPNTSRPDQPPIKCDRFKVIIPTCHDLNHKLMGPEGEYKEWWLSQLQTFNPSFTVDQVSFTAPQYHHSTPAEIVHFRGDKKFLDVSKIVGIPKLKKAETQSLPGQLIPGTTAANPQNSATKAFSIDQELLLADKKTYLVAKEVLTHTEIYCPFCNDIESESASAFIDINPQGRIFISCSHCKAVGDQSTFWARENFIAGHVTIKVFVDDTTGTQIRFIEGAPKSSRLHIFSSVDDWTNWAMAQYGCSPQEARDMRLTLPRLALDYDPSLPHGVNMKVPPSPNIFNTFTPSKYIKKYESLPPNSRPRNLKYLEDNTPTIYRIIKNVVGTDDNMHYFINQFAYTLQTRERPQTAFIIITNPGAGKDTLFGWVISPIFGEENTNLRDGDEMGENFNAEDMNTWLVCYNELGTGAKFWESAKQQKNLRNAITAKEIRIRRLYHDGFTIKNNIFYFLFSNEDHPFNIQNDDRRFFVINTKTKNKSVNLIPTYFKNFREIKAGIEAELDTFAEYLFTVKTEESWATTAILTEDKLALMDQSLSPAQRLAILVKEGRIEDLVEWESMTFKADGGGFNPTTKQYDQPSNFNKNECQRIVKETRTLPGAYLQDIVKAMYGSRDNYGKEQIKQVFTYKKTTKLRYWIPNNV